MNSSFKKEPTMSKKIDEMIMGHQDLSYDEIADIVGLKPDAVRKRYRKLGLPPKKVNSQNGGKEHEQSRFIKFLSKGKTEKELAESFKDWKSLLAKKYEGKTLFTTRNDYFEIVYVLLDIQNVNDIKIYPKKWDFYIAKDDEGKKQPYLMVKLPEFKGKLRIAPLFDVHYGHSAHKKAKFLSYIQWIKDSPDVYAIIGGDLMENAIDDGRGMMYDQDKHPRTQFEDMVHMLAPIAHKILVAIPGNHEERTFKKTGFEVMEALASRLEIPYFSGPVFLDILANTHRWGFHVQHGYGNSQTKGGKMNMAGRPKGFTSAIHFFVSGHVHDRVCECETQIVQDPINCRLRYVDQWVVVAPSFLGWEETYAYRAGYKPPAKGGVSIELEDSGAYRAIQT